MVNNGKRPELDRELEGIIRNVIVWYLDNAPHQIGELDNLLGYMNKRDRGVRRGREIKWLGSVEHGSHHE